MPATQTDNRIAAKEKESVLQFRYLGLDCGEIRASETHVVLLGLAMDYLRICTGHAPMSPSGLSSFACGSWQ